MKSTLWIVIYLVCCFIWAVFIGASSDISWIAMAILIIIGVVCIYMILRKKINKKEK